MNGVFGFRAQITARLRRLEGKIPQGVASYIEDIFSRPNQAGQAL